MAEEIRMPPMGQTTGNLKILSWHKKTGDTVKQGETLLEVETDKATVEVESYASGTLLKVFSQEGEVVEVGSLIASIGQPGEEPGAEPAAETVDAPGAEAPVSPTAAVPPAPADAAPVSTATASTGSRARGALPPGKALASPVARKLAKDQGVDITEVAGSGPGGRIKKEDIFAFISKKKDQAVAAKPSLPRQAEVSDLNRHRRAVAERLTHSFRDIPHIYITAKIDMGEAGRYVRSLKEDLGLKVTYTHLILRAAARALRREPAINRIFLEDGKVKQLPWNRIGLAVAGEDSLLVVAIPDPDGMNLSDLVSYTSEAVKRGRDSKLIGEDLAESSLTISNLGMYGVDQFSAIIDPQQTAILAIGQIAEEPVVRDGGFFARPMMSVTLSADHRIVDGVNGARYLKALREELERRSG
jgi:pyruvate dehydrogenase E2 component (dihydrolipoamide acetyltransferase)